MAPESPNRKKVVFLGQTEPFFMPAILTGLIKGLNGQLTAVGFFSPTVSWRAFRREFLERFFYYGPIDFLRITALYLFKKCAGPSLETIARKNSVPVIRWTGSKLNDPRLWEILKIHQPDFLLILGNQIVPGELLSLAKEGCFNIHVSLLPRHRGREPVFYALLGGDNQLGVTVHQMTEKLDAGNIYAQTAVAKTPSDTVLGCTAALWKMGTGLFCGMVNDWSAHAARPQDERKANYNPFPDRQKVRLFRKKGLRFL